MTVRTTTVARSQENVVENESRVLANHTRRLRIAHIIPIDGIGGVEVAARSMLISAPDQCNFRVFWISSVGMGRSASHPKMQVRTIREVLRFEPDVVICSLWRSVPVGLACKLWRPGIKLVQFLHAERAAHFLDNLLTIVGMRAADAIWADSEKSLTQRALGSKRNQRVISFVTERLTPTAAAPRPSARFVSWGRLAHIKGIDRSIELIALLHARDIDVFYDIWGPDGDAKSALVAHVAARGLKDRIRFFGPLDRSQLSNAATGATFFLQLSRSEGMGMAVVEAMQLGLVPVVTPVGEIGKYVQHGQTGIVVSSTELALAADAIQATLNNVEELAAVRQRAIYYWHGHRIYSDDICDSARSLSEGYK